MMTLWKCTKCGVTYLDPEPHPEICVSCAEQDEGDETDSNSGDN
jgi:rubrerythrin